MKQVVTIHCNPPHCDRCGFLGAIRRDGRFMVNFIQQFTAQNDIARTKLLCLNHELTPKGSMDKYIEIRRDQQGNALMSEQCQRAYDESVSHSQLGYLELLGKLVTAESEVQYLANRIKTGDWEFRNNNSKGT